MEIKKQLKNYDIKISRMASDLNISRPTLDSYIDNYEKGIPLTQNIYQQIFDYLFSTPSDSSIDFARKFDYIKRTYLLNIDRDINVIRENNRELFLTQNITDKIEHLNCSIEMLEFINLFLTNSDKDLVNGIVNYFNITNGFDEYQNYISKEIDKALYSQLFNVFQMYLNNSLELNTHSYEELITKNKRIIDQKQSKETEMIIKYIKQNTGNDSKIDYDYLKTLITKEKI